MVTEGFIPKKLILQIDFPENSKKSLDKRNGIRYNIL